jgi:hypothetical protein
MLPSYLKLVWLRQIEDRIEDILHNVGSGISNNRVLLRCSSIDGMWS